MTVQQPLKVFSTPQSPIVRTDLRSSFSPFRGSSAASIIMITGLEVVVAIATIISAYTSTAMLVAHHKQKRKVKKDGVAEQANQLEGALNEMALTLKSELRGARGWNIASNSGVGPSVTNALWSAWSLLALLESRQLNIPYYRRIADESMALTRLSLQQLTAPQVHINPPLPNSLSRMSPDSGLSHRAQLNVHNICKNALRYRDNKRRFSDLADPIPALDHPKWSCRRCNRRVSQVMLMLSQNSSDNIWIDSCGMLKSHCMKEPNEPPGWTCIWQQVSRDCYLRFSSGLELLKHMKAHHIGADGRGRVTIDWPADSRSWTAETCGYGASIGGRKMRDGNASFVVG